MTFTLTEIFSILIIHWFADFVLQTEKQARGKSKNWSDLLSHTGVYSMVWFLILNTLIISGYLNPSFYLFAPITFIAHTITDYFTSRLNNKLAPKGTVLTMSSNAYGSENLLAFPMDANWRKFFNAVGFDQILHYVQLFTTYYLLK